MLSLVLALLAALGNATASVLQRKADRDEPEGQASGLTLLWHLAHRPAWLGGIAALSVAFLLQAAALATGAIALVQPTLVLELAFTLMLASVVFHTRLRAREWTAIAGMTVGLASMLYAVQPSGGSPYRASTAGWAAGIAVSLALASLFVALGYRTEHLRRAAYLGLATGIGFGLIAALIAGIGAGYGASGSSGVFQTPQTYLVIVLGPGFFYLLQKTLQAGRLVASQPALTLANPVVSVVFGVAVFGEHLRTGTWLILALFGAALIIACTILLARSPLLSSSEPTQSPTPPQPPSDPPHQATAPVHRTPLHPTSPAYGKSGDAQRWLTLPLRIRWHLRALKPLAREMEHCAGSFRGVVSCSSPGISIVGGVVG